MKTEIVRLERPSLAEYQDAFQVCETVWPYLAPLNTVQRFVAFQSLGVEILVARRDGRPIGTCFLLPEQYLGARSEPCDFVWLFDFAVLPEGRGAGTSLLAKAMRTYPNLMVVGVTPMSAPLYEGLKWKRFDGLWRCVHPLDITGLLKAHSTTQPAVVPYAARTVALVYDAASSILEASARRFGSGLSLLTGGETSPSVNDERFHAVARYLPSISVCNGKTLLAAVQRAGTGRIVADNANGWPRLLSHLLVWGYMRAGGAYLCEYLTTSHIRALAGVLLGYVPIRMPIYYRDTNGALAHYINSLPTRQYSFGCCEKIL